MKNILILTGSARYNGNSEIMADTFADVIKKSGHKVAKYRTAVKNIKGCFACDQCWTKGRACTVDDDFKELQPLLEEADVLVLASPLYWFSFSSHLKATIDKLYAYSSKNKPLKVKETALLMCGEDDETKSFNGVIQTYKDIVDYMKWYDKGMVIATGLSAKGAIKNTPFLKDVEKLAQKI